MSRFKALVTDVDGVITEVDSVWQFLHKEFGTLKEAERNKRLYEAGVIDYDGWAKLDAMLWRGRTFDEVMAALRKVGVRKGAKELIDFAKSKGLKVIAVSAGIDTLYFVLKERGVDFDYFFANKLVFDKGGRVTGHVISVVEAGSKGEFVKVIAKVLGIDTSEIIAIGDSEVDIPMFEVCGYSIAFNPKSSEVASKAKKVVTGNDLYGVLEELKKLLGS